MLRSVRLTVQGRRINREASQEKTRISKFANTSPRLCCQESEGRFACRDPQPVAGREPVPRRAAARGRASLRLGGRRAEEERSIGVGLQRRPLRPDRGMQEAERRQGSGRVGCLHTRVSLPPGCSQRSPCARRPATGSSRPWDGAAGLRRGRARARGCRRCAGLSPAMAFLLWAGSAPKTRIHR